MLIEEAEEKRDGGVLYGDEGRGRNEERGEVSRQCSG